MLTPPRSHRKLVDMRSTAVRKGSLLLGSLAVAAMGTVTVACSPRTEEPAEPSGASVSVPSPTEKQVRTNVTKSPILDAPPQKPSTNCHDPNNSINCVITGGPAAGEVVPN